jgi:FkbM family methyltransferase
VLTKVPRNETVIREFGPYPSLMMWGTGMTEAQRHARDTGLANVEPITRATLLTLVQLAPSRPVEFFDIGAHVGLHSLVVSTVYPADVVHVTAFEPTPRTAAMCRTLAGANQRQIRIERCAISDTDGTAELYISPWESSNSLQVGFRPAKETVPVRTVTLDSYCRERGLWPDVVKIDVETYESHVLAGAKETLTRARPPIVCEILEVTERSATERTLGYLDDAGYHPHRWTREDGWLPCTADDVIDQAPHLGNDWLFTPEPTDGRFPVALAEWRAAIAECGAKTTVRVPAPGPFSRPPLYRPNARGQRRGSR